ncbi:ABC transporter permease [Rhodobacter capsulatus]|jgi:His/Glu/Gln/Arg/opine family amino acid ABC transporter permease subunit|uniref:Amino acid ABC transporter, permease protein n=1 Tax=Rhodobacter capsulatus (strain ATCC BAA-309 / NBRC 16581 / SB1003) TaxID=272942 RepID=D5ANN7_RHOCB|nr:ABC transporter permease subunit [Rhodobacter capsulatus]ADE84391.1 amino acid ABC transporter, permease protein [Rhodobacter capsulatus SB 1003]ETD83468.1 amino acid ABC transporter permease [Rhodobacter capsulatus YW1]ETD87591.1 amino acid ABC transporter permease [Rhodobacter capsulatus B6]MDS0926074.1 ABC transporter permease subunit [Rhodobacter capsulatus]TQD34102.1 ABC transporter permease subunit [Rhodobacter capsulatus]
MSLIESLSANLPKLLDGLETTLILTGLGAALAAVFSPGLALIRLSGPAPAKVLLRVYISFMRGTPLLAQLFLVFYGSGQFRAELTTLGLWSFFRDPFNCAVLVFVLNSCAYQTEILRGGLQAVPPGEIEAARAIGMTRAQVLARVTFPHAYRIAWPALGNEVILLMKASALASIVTVFDLMGRTRQIFSRSFEFSVYFEAAVLYLLITVLFVFLWRQIERRLTRPMRRTQGN